MKEGVLKDVKEIAYFVMYFTVIYHFSTRRGKKRWRQFQALMAPKCISDKRVEHREKNYFPVWGSVPYKCSVCAFIGLRNLFHCKRISKNYYELRAVSSLMTLNKLILWLRETQSQVFIIKFVWTPCFVAT